MLPRRSRLKATVLSCVVTGTQRPRADTAHDFDNRVAVLLQIGMLLWSYFACSLTVPGHVPPHWSPFPDPEVRCSFDNWPK